MSSDMKLQICPRQTLLAKLPGLRRCELPVKVVRLPVVLLVQLWSDHSSLYCWLIAMTVTAVASARECR